MQAYHADLTYESMQRGGSEEYLCMRNPVETDGSRSDLYQQGSSSCLARAARAAPLLRMHAGDL